MKIKKFRWWKQEAGSWMLSLLIIFFVFLAYANYSSLWVNFGGFEFEKFRDLMFEAPLILSVSVFFFFPKIKNRFCRYLPPLVFGLVFYTSFDVFYSFLKRSPHPSDLRNISTVTDFSPWFGQLIFIWLIIVPTASLLFLIWHTVKDYPPKKFFISWGGRLVFFFLIAMLLGSASFGDFYTKKFNYIDWSQERTIKSNGRLASFIYYGIQEEKNKVALRSFSKNKLSNTVDIHNTLYPDHGMINKRNVHFIVLESFLDPRLIEDASFNTSPLSEDLVPFMLEGENFSYVESPVYGGRTAQAEFELLSGIKALSKIDSIEFNVMMGRPADSFIKKLTDCGYQSIATIASGSGYFNSKQAYRTLGIKKVSFLKDIDQFSEPDWMPVFDGDVFQYHQEAIESLANDKRQPLVSYVLGMYGHFPYGTDSEKQPDVIEVQHDDERVHKIANQFFYRTEAVAKYIKRLLQVDPDCVIYITSDHLPPILWDGTRYMLDQHMNIALLLDAGKPVDVSGKKYFQIPWLIWEILEGRDNSHYIDEAEMENLYFKLLSASISK